MPQNRKLTIDHKVPISRGGTNDRKNLCCSCEEHNFDKKDRTAEEYIELLKKKIGNN
jgi:5-methylcytosine-specific restriction endonuclease McrA